MSAEFEALIKRNEELRAALAAETIKFIAAFTPAQATPVPSGTPPLEHPGVVKNPLWNFCGRTSNDFIAALTYAKTGRD